jgi:hypothetical protein
MSDGTQKSPRWIWWALLVLIVLYPLSTGPVLLLTGRCTYPVYAPLFWLGEKSNFFGGLLFFWWVLWGAKT